MDEAEFDDFYAASFRRVTGQVYAMIGDLDEAQECVQEAFARAWSHRRKLDRADHPEAWVRTTAHRIAISRWRRRTRGRRPADRALAGPTTTAAPDVHHVALVTALAQLPEPQRRVDRAAPSRRPPRGRRGRRDRRPRGDGEGPAQPRSRRPRPTALGRHPGRHEPCLTPSTSASATSPPKPRT